MNETARVVIRAMTLDDLPSMRNITWLTWVATYAPFIPEEDLRIYFDAHYSLEELTRLFAKETVKGFMAFVDEAAAGFVKTEYSREEKRFYVSSLYVLPDHQGEGIGGKLYRVAEEHGLTFGADRVWLGVMEQNVRALAWYRRLGFDFSEKQPFTMGASTVDHLIGSRMISTTDAHR